MGVVVGGSFKREGIYAYIQLTHIAVQQKLTQYCKAIISQSLSSGPMNSVSHVWLFATPWIAAHKASLSITNSRSMLKLMPIESEMPSNHLILCCPFSSFLQSFPASGSFQMSQFFTSGSQSIRVSASASVLPMNIQD